MRRSPMNAAYLMRRPTPADADAVQELLVAWQRRYAGEVDITRQDVIEYWQELDLNQDAWLVEASGQVVAAADLIGPYRGAFHGDVQVHPEHEGRGLGSQLTGLLEERARAKAAALGRALPLRHRVLQPNESALPVLESAGYEIVRYFYRMEIDLAQSGPPAPPTWPDGVSVRTFRPGEDDALAHAVLEESFLDHWGWEPTDLAEFQKRMKKSRWDPALWFLLFEGEQCAAVALCGRSTETVGWVNNLGVRRPWRRRGLGEALLAHSLIELHRRGLTTVRLGVDAASPTGATRLYERAGMSVVRRTTVFAKEIVP